MNRINSMTQYVCRAAQDIRECVCGNGSQSNNVRNNSTNRDDSPIPFDSLMHSTPVTIQPARILTNQDQGPALRDTLDNNNQDLNTNLDHWVNEAPDECEVRQRVKDHLRPVERARRERRRHLHVRVRTMPCYVRELSVVRTVSELCPLVVRTVLLCCWTYDHPPLAALT